MKDVLSKFNKVFENRIRLGIMSLLLVHNSLEYVRLRKELGQSLGQNITDGNLASHVKMLLKHEYISEDKKFVNRKPQTTYEVTTQGRKAFEQHLEALEALLKGFDNNEGR